MGAPPQFARHVKAAARDRNGDLVPGARITWFVNGVDAGAGVESEGFSTMDVLDPNAAVSVQATYDGVTLGPVALAPNQQDYDFAFDVEVHPPWRSFFMKHFPAIVGIVFILLTIVLVFVFAHPTALQTHVILATLALGAGGFAGEISGFLNVNLTLGKKLAVTAGGALAVFVLLYFFVPAGTPG